MSIFWSLHSAITPGTSQGTIYNAGDQPKVGCMKASASSSVLILQSHKKKLLAMCIIMGILDKYKGKEKKKKV